MDVYIYSFQQMWVPQFNCFPFAKSLVVNLRFSSLQITFKWKMIFLLACTYCFIKRILYPIVPLPNLTTTVKSQGVISVQENQNMLSFPPFNYLLSYFLRVEALNSMTWLLSKKVKLISTAPSKYTNSIATGSVMSIIVLKTAEQWKFYKLASQLASCPFWVSFKIHHNLYAC